MPVNDAVKIKANTVTQTDKSRAVTGHNKHKSKIGSFAMGFIFSGIL